jgi:hypothetical protein
VKFCATDERLTYTQSVRSRERYEASISRSAAWLPSCVLLGITSRCFRCSFRYISITCLTPHFYSPWKSLEILGSLFFHLVE